MKTFVESSAIKSKDTFDLLHTAANWFAKRRKMPKKLRLIISVSPFLRGDDTRGECYQMEPRLYNVILSRATLKMLDAVMFEGLQILFHELTHVEQFVAGDLYYQRNRKGDWKMHYNGTKVENMPWEEQPHERLADWHGAKLAHKFERGYKKALARKAKKAVKANG